MHKVTISSKETNTEVNNNYEAMVFIGIPAGDGRAMECLLLGKNTNDAAIDATVKTKLLHALRNQAPFQWDENFRKSLLCSDWLFSLPQSQQADWHSFCVEELEQSLGPAIGQVPDPLTPVIRLESLPTQLLEL